MDENVRPIVESTIIPEYADTKRFFEGLTKLCNECRVTITIDKLLILRNEVSDGKLLDVVGFYKQEDGRMILPAFVDRMSGEDKGA